MIAPALSVVLAGALQLYIIALQVATAGVLVLAIAAVVFVGMTRVIR